MESEHTDNWIVIYQAPDEATANIVAGLLQSEGIDALPVSSATTWGGQAAIIDSTTRFQEKYWGNVIVKEVDVDRSLELMKACVPEEINDTPKPYPTTPGPSAFLVRAPLFFMACIFGFAAYCSIKAQLLALGLTCLYGAGCGIFVGFSLSGSQKRVTSKYRTEVLRSANYLYVAAFAWAFILVAMVLFSSLQKFITGISIAAALVFMYGALRKVSQDTTLE